MEKREPLALDTQNNTLGIIHKSRIVWVLNAIQKNIFKLKAKKP